LKLTLFENEFQTYMRSLKNEERVQ